MARKFVPRMKADKLREIIERDLINEDFERYALHEYFGSDLKVDFDMENFHFKNEWNTANLLGYHTLENGLTFCGMSGGGDWEYPVFFIVYFDGKKLRAYIPTDGNPWNTTTKRAYGNDEKADLKNAKARWPEAFKSAVDFEVGDVDCDDDLIKGDILRRFS